MGSEGVFPVIGEGGGLGSAGGVVGAVPALHAGTMEAVRCSVVESALLRASMTARVTDPCFLYQVPYVCVLEFALDLYFSLV
jgi:hypothetical protein